MTRKKLKFQLKPERMAATDFGVLLLLPNRKPFGESKHQKRLKGIQEGSTKDAK
jgi:hypothetical protein